MEFKQKKLKTKPLKSQLQITLKQHVKTLLSTNENEREEHQKNAISSFLKGAFEYENINTKNSIDLAIYEEQKPSVLIECKRLNSHEFPTYDKLSNTYNLLCMAFYEIILYFLQEIAQNNHIKHIILATMKEFYILDAQEFLSFSKDKAILKEFNAYKNKTATNISTKAFYDFLATYLPTLHLSLNFIRLDLENTKDSNLAKINYILSQPYLLKQSRSDPNTLNQKFYDELLYILGLEEVLENGKVKINIANTNHSLSNQIKQSFPNLTNDDIMELLILWNNRILFIKLLESNLIAIKHIKEPFLTTLKIPDFTTLNTLFFEILAKKEKQRLNEAFSYIPYLNSSLFEKQHLEAKGSLISSIANEKLAIFKNSGLKDIFKDSTKTLPLLEYLFKFLSSYNFSTTPSDIKDNINKTNSELINPAVLGLVFEKINGYKEGSFYTPSFITMHMAKDCIVKAVLNKFAESGLKANSINELSNEIINLNNIKKAQDIFYSLRIIDPSVGSGHFLVSALNELILIQSNLGILTDELGKKIVDIKIELKNDEILIKNEEGKLHAYTKPAHNNISSHRLQKALFESKKAIIQNCLFGVDINPNSVNICTLRLWIELLKNTYFKENEKGDITNCLETLPNIDINIKCGNSLIYHFPLDSTFKIGLTKEFSQNLKEQISKYKKSVFAYKNALSNKASISKDIQSIKQTLTSYLSANSSQMAHLKKSLEEFVKSYDDKAFDIDTPFGMQMLRLSRVHNYKFQPSLYTQKPKELDKDAAKLLTSLKSDYEYLENLEKGESFEWRFEFPEVLESNGDFKGFDLVLGNPPYIRQEEIKDLKAALQSYTIYKGTSDIYTYFFELGSNILSNKGILSFITSNKWTRASYGEPLRTLILDKLNLKSYIELNGIKVFDKASVDTSIITLCKYPSKDSTFFYAHPKNMQDFNALALSKIPISSLSSKSFSFAPKALLELKSKIESKGVPLKEWDININRGILTGYNEAFIIDSKTREQILESCQNEEERNKTSKLIKKILRGRDIKKYSYEWAGLWVINTHNGYNKTPSVIATPPVIASVATQSTPSVIARNSQEFRGKRVKKRVEPINIQDYPALKAYLDSFYPQLEKRLDKGITPL